MCQHGCSRNHRANFFGAHPHGYPFANGLYKCVSCGGDFTQQEITVDHIMPQALYGAHPNIHCINNLQPMCRSCNSRKNKHISTIDVARHVAGSDGRLAANSEYWSTGGSSNLQY